MSGGGTGWGAIEVMFGNQKVYGAVLATPPQRTYIEVGTFPTTINVTIFGSTASGGPPANMAFGRLDGFQVVDALGQSIPVILRKGDCNGPQYPEVPPCSPEIVVQPEPQTVCAGQSASLRVVVINSSTTEYQWYRSGFPVVDSGHVSGSTTPTLTVTQGTSADTGAYSCQIRTECTTLNSAVVSMAFREFGVCCFSGGACALAVDGCTCPNGATFINGVHFPGGIGTCSPGPCGSPTGACCFGAGICLVLTAGQCSGAGDSYRGDGTTCGPTLCPPTGVCCNSTVGGCSLVYNGAACPAGWTQVMSATSCDPVSPCTLTRRACCRSSGECVMKPILECDGKPSSDGTCGPDACATSRSVCCGDGGCHEIDASASCRGINVLGVGSCADITCITIQLPFAGVCCRGATCAVTLTESACVGEFTQFVPLVQECNAPNQNTMPCCKADFDKTGMIETTDLFTYLNQWFANNLFCDISGNGMLETADIFQYLNAWFQGC